MKVLTLAHVSTPWMISAFGCPIGWEFMFPPIGLENVGFYELRLLSCSQAAVHYEPSLLNNTQFRLASLRFTNSEGDA